MTYKIKHKQQDAPQADTAIRKASKTQPNGNRTKAKKANEGMIETARFRYADRQFKYTDQQEL